MALRLPIKNFKAFLFDCDGTIVDSMPLHFKAWNLALAKWGGRFDREVFYELAGVPLPKTVEILNERFSLKMPPEEVAVEKEIHYYRLLNELKLVAEVWDVIQEHQNKLPFAVVSGSPRESVIKSLTQVGVLERFPIIVGGDDVQRGKPAPDGFLRAAALLNVLPQDCLVFEDADLGIQAAEAAGMSWVKIEQKA